MGLLALFQVPFLGLFSRPVSVALLAWLNNVFGLNLFDAYFINYLPSYLRWQDVVVIVGLSLTLSFLATIYPALRAAKIQPAEAFAL